MRKRLLSGLRNTPGTCDPLTGKAGEEIAAQFVGACSAVLVSTDLTRATDLLPLEAMEAVIEGLRQSGRLSPLELSILTVLNGPQRLAYGDVEVVSSRGCLMGLPTSWCMLSLIHLFWLSESKRKAFDARNRRDFRYSICGDDALVATNTKGAEAYKKIVSEFRG